MFARDAKAYAVTFVNAIPQPSGPAGQPRHSGSFIARLPALRAFDGLRSIQSFHDDRGERANGQAVTRMVIHLPFPAR